MQTKFRFTNAAIKALPAQQREAGATELEFSDTEVIGLKLLSGKSQGSKRFLLRYTLQGKKRSIALGRFGDIDVSQARTIARKYKAMLAEGIDPVAEQDSYKTEPTLSEFFWQTFLPHLKTIGKRSINSDIQRFKHNIEPRFGAMCYRQLKAMDVLQLQSEMVHPNNPSADGLRTEYCQPCAGPVKDHGQLCGALGHSGHQRGGQDQAVEGGQCQNALPIN
ncbi:Arm DNA-binding domain-containing protein [Aeromonas veronii]|uniref:Arm DNA-binding domain-containing protein n=1 Tax=Aeromonas TaxID=642 RepID=UPI00225AC6CF|nr:Arm DNA-binding domain-containing protein [Aeromonas veronii]MCX4047129.1 Arm DNA-binding domain-containing protein [Aeromonas veronii]